MRYKEKLKNNILICKELLSDFEKEMERIDISEDGIILYYDCNKDKINRSRIIIGEKLLEVEKAVKERRQDTEDEI